MSSRTHTDTSISSSSTHPFNLDNKGTYITLEPLNLEFKYGQDTYKITFIKQRMGENGEERNLDLSKLTLEDIQTFRLQAEKVMDAVNRLNGRPDSLISSHSITIHFTQNPESGPTLIEKTVGKIFKETWGWKEQNMVLEKITYKETATSEEKTFTVKLETYDTDSQKELFKTTLPLKRTIRQVIHREQENLKPDKLTKPVIENNPTEIVDLTDLNYWSDEESLNGKSPTEDSDSEYFSASDGEDSLIDN